MKLTIDFKSLEWWYWFVTLIAMTAGLIGIVDAFYIVILVSVIHFTATRGFAAFPTQVRFVYALCVIVALYDATLIFYWILLCGTVTVVLFDTFFIARILVFMPWNKDVKLS